MIGDLQAGPSSGNCVRQRRCGRGDSCGCFYPGCQSSYRGGGNGARGLAAGRGCGEAIGVGRSGDGGKRGAFVFWQTKALVYGRYQQTYAFFPTIGTYCSIKGTWRGTCFCFCFRKRWYGLQHNTMVDAKRGAVSVFVLFCRNHCWYVLERDCVHT